MIKPKNLFRVRCTFQQSDEEALCASAWQTSHFHLYVNAEYVNKPCSTTEGNSCWAWIYHLQTV